MNYNLNSISKMANNFLVVLKAISCATMCISEGQYKKRMYFLKHFQQVDVHVFYVILCLL